MKTILVSCLMLVSSLSAFAEEHIEKYNIFGSSYELGINDSEVLLEDFKVKKVPTVVKVTTFDFCDDMDMCRSYEVLESQEVLQLSFNYNIATPLNSEELSMRRFDINFPISSLPLNEIEELRLLGRGINTPKKMRTRVSMARKFFSEDTKTGLGKKTEIDYERSTLCFPEDPYCVEEIKFVTREIPVKQFSVLLK